MTTCSKRYSIEWVESSIAVGAKTNTVATHPPLAFYFQGPTTSALFNSSNIIPLRTFEKPTETTKITA